MANFDGQQQPGFQPREQPKPYSNPSYPSVPPRGYGPHVETQQPPRPSFQHADAHHYVDQHTDLPRMQMSSQQSNQQVQPQALRKPPQNFPPSLPSRPATVPRPRIPQKPTTLRGKDGKIMFKRAPQPQEEELTFTKKDIIIAVMGVTGAGKSTFISLLTGAKLDIGHGLRSCTQSVGVHSFELEGKRIFLIDTPGFDDTERSDSEVLKDVAFWLAAAYTRDTKLAGIIYLHRISDVKMGGAATRNLRMFRKLCGEDNLDSVILATTHWRNSENVPLPEDVGQRRIDELVESMDFWGGMVGRGSKVVKHDGTRDCAVQIISDLVHAKNRVVLDIQVDMVDRKMELNDTDAGRALQSELLAERKKFKEKMSGLKDDMEKAVREKDEKWQKEILEERARNDAKIKQTYAETKALRTDIKKITAEKDAQYQALQEEMRKEREKHEAQVQSIDREFKAHRAEQTRLAAEHERQKKEAHEKNLRAQQENQKELRRLEARMREEHDANVREQIERQKEAYQQVYEQQQEEAERLRHEQRQQWDEIQEQARLREERMDEERREALERAAEADKRARKRNIFNPMRWLGGEKYRPA